ncbi:MAG: hypothetical protein LC118_12075, partial [Dehalococcoidia bacterium]|nr:hypothetical protein [Dehalococcoidia bacterium]
CASCPSPLLALPISAYSRSISRCTSRSASRLPSDLPRDLPFGPEDGRIVAHRGMADGDQLRRNART